MNCAIHAEIESVDRCRGCSALLCVECGSRCGPTDKCGLCPTRNRRRRPRGIRLLPLLLLLLGVAGVSLKIVDEIVDAPYFRARRERAAIEAMRKLPTAQAKFRETDAENDNFLDYATSLAELQAAGLIDADLGSGRIGGYDFSLSGSTFDWRAWATPTRLRSVHRNFKMCTDGVVRAALNQPARCTSGGECQGRGCIM